MPEPKAGQGHNSLGEAGERLQVFVERIERLNEENKANNTDKSEIFKEARGMGFNVPVLKQVIRRRGMDASDRTEADSLLDLYERALSEGGTKNALTREQEKPEPAPLPPVDGTPPPADFDPDTGEIAEEPPTEEPAEKIAQKETPPSPPSPMPLPPPDTGVELMSEDGFVGGESDEEDDDLLALPPFLNRNG